MAKYFEFEVWLRDIEPKIWRRFLLKSTATFQDLHRAIQDAGGWEDYHLFRFDAKRSFRDPVAEAQGADQYDDTSGPPARSVKLASYFQRPRKKCLYTYDYGDSWELDVQLIRTVQMEEPFKRRLLGGARAFPLEDSGGSFGYYDCLAALGLIEAGHCSPEMLQEKREWLGDWHPEAFDLEQAKRAFDE